MNELLAAVGARVLNPSSSNEPGGGRFTDQTVANRVAAGLELVEVDDLVLVRAVKSGQLALGPADLCWRRGAAGQRTWA